MTFGSSTRLRYHAGCLAAPPLEAITAYVPSCSTRMSGDLRRLPLRRPLVVKITTGTPRSVFALAPPDASYFSAWLAAHFDGLRWYSPWIGILSPLVVV